MADHARQVVVSPRELHAAQLAAKISKKHGWQVDPLVERIADAKPASASNDKKASA